MTSDKYGPAQEVSFADGYPLLMISEESLSQLNEKLTHPIKMDRFRANLIVKGGHPHIEDEYHDIQVGKVRLKALKPCSRCSVITIDQATTQKTKEPLATLSEYRKVGNKVLFGQNLILQSSDDYEFKVGDLVTFSNKKARDPKQDAKRI